VSRKRQRTALQPVICTHIISIATTTQRVA